MHKHQDGQDPKVPTTMFLSLNSSKWVRRALQIGIEGGPGERPSALKGQEVNGP